MKTLNQAIFYLVVFLWIVALVKMILVYIHWDAETIFTAGCILMTFIFIPSLLLSYRGKGIKHYTLIFILSIALSILAYFAGTITGLGSLLPNFWIGILLQAFGLGILSLVTTDRKIILIIWIVWLSFSIVLMTLHLVNGTL